MLVLAGCARHISALPDGNVTTLSGKYTAGYSPAQASKRMLGLAARIAVDHGFRYFRIIGPEGAGQPIEPGISVRVRLYGEGDVDPAAPGIYDASAILMKGVSASDLRRNSDQF